MVPVPWAFQWEGNKIGTFILPQDHTVIADALAKQGIATLRYDDRGFGESTGDLVNVTTEDLKNDAFNFSYAELTS